MGIFRKITAVGLATTAMGCQTLPDIPDKRLQGQGGARGYGFANLARGPGNTDQTLVLLAFSGGGARAAAMAYGVLERLRTTEIGTGANRRLLLAEVDVISGTSGGSFTAAFYGLFREKMFERGADGLTLYERRYLKRRVTRELSARAFFNIIRINTPAVNRSDVAAEYYGETIFANRTYADLMRLGRPMIAINAHDTTKHSRFVFTQSQFDQICNDLTAYPVSRAVTASSAVHGVFAPIKLRNYAPGNRACPPEPAWVPAALAGSPAGRTVIEAPRDRRRLARLLRWYRTGEPYGAPTVRDEPYFVHLADGGAMDNMAVWPVLRALGSPISDWGVRQLLATGKVRRVLLIIVDATPAVDGGTDRDPGGPSLPNMIRSAVDSAIEIGSRDAVRMTGVLFDQLRRRYPKVTFHEPVVIAFDDIRDPRQRRCFFEIGTALDLPARTIDALRRLAVRQLDSDPAFRKFLQAMGGRRSGAIDFGAAGKFCPQKG